MKAILASALVATFAITSCAQTQLVDLASHVWRYRSDGTDLGSGWRGTNYDDSTWSSGTSLFGFETNAAVSGMIHTTLPLSGSGGSIVTYYFRTHFNYDGSVLNPYLMISNIVDDGAVFYLNGTEFGRVLMPGGPIGYSAFSIMASLEGTFTILERRATNLVIGDNLLAVEVHQRTLNDSDVVFGSAVFVEPESATTNAGTMDYSFDAIVNNYVRSSVLLTNSQFLVGGGFSQFDSNLNANGLAKIDRFGKPVPGFDGGTNLGGGNLGSFDVYPIVVTNGHIYVGGNFKGGLRTNIARLNWDGSLDTTFVPDVPNARVRAIVPQADGRVVIAGEFTSVGNGSKTYIARLLPNGSLDTTFATNGGANNRIRAVMPLADGRFLIGGAFTAYDGVTQNYIARLATNGARDTTFTNAASAEVYCFTKSGSNYYVGGNFTSFNGLSAPRLARIDADGHLDLNFNIGLGFSGGAVYFVTEQFDGRLIIGGEFTSAAGSTAYAYLTRYLSDGSHDDSFNVSAPTGGYALTATLAPDGKTLVGGNFFYQLNRRSTFPLTLLRADDPPRLSIARESGIKSISWPDVASSFVLEESISATGPWTNSGLQIGTRDRRFVATNSASSNIQFYRLHSQ